jgi:hypothetical protein
LVSSTNVPATKLGNGHEADALLSEDPKIRRPSQPRRRVLRLCGGLLAVGGQLRCLSASAFSVGYCSVILLSLLDVVVDAK